jgi:hypothetical protein
MPDSIPATQSPADRRAAEAELKGLVKKFAPKQQPLVASLRRAVRKRLPSAYEIVYEYSTTFVISFAPNDRGYEGVLVISGGAGGIKLYLGRAKELPDPEKLLQGSGGKARWIDIDDVSTLTRPAVKRLIDAAIAANPVPFARSGKGQVIVRSTTAKKRRSAK